MSKKNKTAQETTIETRNYQSYQQALLIALLNKNSNIRFKQNIYGRSSDNFLRLDRISFSPYDEINIEQFLKSRAKDLYDQDIINGVPEKTATRRVQLNRRIESSHLCMDLLREFGYTFEVSEHKGKHDSKKLDYIKRVFFEGKTLNVEKESLKELHVLITKKIEEGPCNIILMNDDEIQSFIHFN